MGEGGRLSSDEDIQGIDLVADQIDLVVGEIDLVADQIGLIVGEIDLVARQIDLSPVRSI